MSKEKKEIMIGDEFTVEFIKSEKPGLPICRCDGMVGFIDKAEKGIFIPGQTWVVSIVKVFDKFLIVKPLLKMTSRKDNQKDFQAKLDFFKKDKRERVKVKRNYAYQSKQELLQGEI